MIKYKFFLVLVIVACIAFSSCDGHKTDLPMSYSQIPTGDFALVAGRDREWYKVDDKDKLVALFPLLNSAVLLKEPTGDAIKVMLVENDALKSSYYVFDPHLYPDWDYDTPQELIDLLPSLMEDDCRIQQYVFANDDPNSHGDLMAALKAEEDLIFYYPRHDLDSEYPALAMYYTCYDNDMDDSQADKVLNEAVDWLEEQEWIHLRGKTSLSFFSPNTREGCYSRRIEIRLKYPMGSVMQDKVAGILEYNTSEAPFLRPDGTPSGVVKYSEEEPYPICMISKMPVSSERLKQIELRYDISIMPLDNSFYKYGY